MIDINLIINSPDIISAKLANRGYSLDITKITKLHDERKSLIKIKESIAASKNKLNDKFKDAKSEDGTDRLWGMEYDKLVPILIKAVQELSAKVEALENA